MLLGRCSACILLALVAALRFSSAFLVIFPFSLTCVVMMVTIIKKYTIKEFQSYGSSGQIAQESLSSIRTVLSLGLHRKFIQKYKENLTAAESVSKKKGLYIGIFSGFSEFFINSAFAVAIYYGVYLIRTDCKTFSPGLIVQSFFSMLVGSMGIAQALPYLRDLAGSRGAAAKVFAIIQKESKIDVFKSKGKKLNELKGSIEFKDVVFSYPQRAEIDILKGLDLSIPAGKTIALVGSRFYFFRFSFDF
jgi:ATP-binding cassette subfamily B (MDR/TAP) protein 1